MLPYTVTIQLQDETGSKGSATAYIARGASFASAEAAAGALAARVAAISSCSVIGYDIKKEFWLSPRPVRPTTGDPLQRGLLVFAAGPDNYWAATIPAIKPALVMVTGDDAGIGLNQSAPALSALIAALISGPWSALNAQGLTALEVAYREVLP